MQDIDVHSWIGGMDQDTSKSKFQNNKYFEMWNGRVTTDSNLTSGAIENVRGNKDVILLPNIPSSATLGLSLQTFSEMTNVDIFDLYSFQNDVVIFSTSTDSGNTFFQIWKTVYSNEDSLTPNALTDLKICVDITGITLTEIKRVICHFEYGTNADGGIYKIYWTDGITNLKSLNLYENNLYGTSSKCLDITFNDTNAYSTSDFNLNTDITFSLLLGGQYKSGMVQYAYQLFGNSKADTIYSKPSNLIHLTSSFPDTTGTNENYIGTNKGEDVNKSVQLTISNISSFNKYRNIRIFAIFWDDFNGTPVIRFIESSLNADNITIIDSGDFIDTIPYTDFVGKTFNLFSCQDIAIKNNRLLACNIKYDNLLTVLDSEFDARAFRFDNSRVAHITTGVTTTTINGITKAWSGGGTWADIPIIHDCINNDTLLGVSDDVQTDLYQSDGTTIGGEGINIKYKFSYLNKILDNDITLDNTIVTQVDLYGNPQIHYEKVGYQRDEIYSFGIEFTDNIGRISSVKWIGDIRFPSEYFSGDGFVTSNGSITTGKILYIQFEVNNIPAGLKYRIVRCERTNDNKTILFSGVLDKIDLSSAFIPTFAVDITTVFLPTFDIDTTTTFLGTFYDSTSDTNYHPRATIRDLFGGTNNYGAILYSPEISFFGKDNKGYYSFKPEDYIVYSLKEGSDIIAPVNFGREVIIDESTTQQSKSYKINSYASIDSSKHLISLDSKTQIVNPREIIDTSQDIRYSNFDFGSIRGTHLFLDIADTSTITDLTYVHVKRAIIPYGGNTYNDRLGRTYIPCTSFLSTTGSYIDVFNGDTFISKSIYLDSVYSFINTTQFLPNILAFPSESTIDTYLRTDKIFYDASKNGGVITSEKWFIEETLDTGNSLYPSVYGIFSGITEVNEDLYIYNQVYSKENDIIKSFPQADNLNIRTEFRQRILYSEKKIAGISKVDAWISFPSINYKDVDGNYGEVHALNVYNDQMYFFQDKAFGLQPVEERITTNAENGDVLILGEGDILGKYGYISYNSGCRYLKSIINTEENFHFYDSRLNRWNIYSPQGFQIASITKFMNSFFLNIIGSKTVSNIYGVYDSKYNGVIMNFNFSDNSYYTLSYNQFIDAFESFHTFNPKCFTQFNNQYLTIPILGTGNNQSVYLHSTSKGEYGTYYPNSSVEALYELKLKFISNKYPDKAKIFTNIEFNSTVYDSNNEEYFEAVTHLPDTFTKFRIYNDYQDSEEYDLINYNEL